MTMKTTLNLLLNLNDDHALTSSDAANVDRNEQIISDGSIMANKQRINISINKNGMINLKNHKTTNSETILNIPNPSMDEKATEFFNTKADGRVKLRLGTEHSAAVPITVHTLLASTIKRAGSKPALAYKKSLDQRGFEFITYQHYYDQCCLAAKSFIKLGLKPYNGVGILGFNSPEWLICNMGAIFAGGFSTGIYTTNSPEACQFVAESCKANVLVVENRQQLLKILSICDQLPLLKAIVQYKDEVTVKNDIVYSWEEFLKIGKEVDDSVLIERISTQVPNQCCSLIYTSGTTGNPKGVMLSHDNLTFTSLVGAETTNVQWAEEHFVSYLPLSHIAAQITDIYIPMACGGCVYFANPDALKGSLGVTLKEVRPTLFLGVPRVWEKIQDKMLDVGRNVTGLKRVIATWAKGVGYRAGISRMNNQDLPFGYTLANMLVLSKVREALGLDRCKLCLTGAAPISKETLDYFMSLGIIIFELYGMSESSGPQTINLPDSFLMGSVGRDVQRNGTNTRLDNPDEEGNGEVCMRGRNVFMGYLNEQDKTEDTIDAEGWLHSGDIGRKDENGFLFITGRIKELIITAGGENIAPVPVEDKVKELLPCISNCMLVGDKLKFLSILLTFKTEIDEKNDGLPLDKLAPAALKWCSELGSKVTTVEEIRKLKEPCIFAAIQKGIDDANEFSISRASRIAKWTILPKDFSIAGGELGPTLKLRRPIVTKMYEDVINSLYVD